MVETKGKIIILLFMVDLELKKKSGILVESRSDSMAHNAARWSRIPVLSGNEMECSQDMLKR